jgi:hypothetical protein
MMKSPSNGNDAASPSDSLRATLKNVHDLFVTDLWAKWKDHRDVSGLDAMVYSRLSVVSLSHVASIAAVDVGMTEDQFCDVCRANFKEAHARAPRFG